MALQKRYVIALIALVTLMLIFAFSFTPAMAADQDEEPSMELMFCDLVILRPLGMATTVLGYGTYLFSLPFTKDHNREQAKRILVTEPAKYTFDRPLGVGVEEIWASDLNVIRGAEDF